MKCQECDGSGEAPNQDYRTPANKVDTKLNPRMRFTTFMRRITGLKKHLNQKVFGRIALIVACLAAFGGIIKLGIDGNRSIRAERAIHNQYIARMGYVVALYNEGQGKLIKCWITNPRTHQWNDDTVIDGPMFPYNGPNFTWIEVPNRDDASGFAKNIGVEDISQCQRTDK